MARIVADGLEIQDLSAGYWFEIAQGGLDYYPTVRGEDVVIPGKDGQTWMPKVYDTIPVVLHGIVFGDGATPGVSYRTRFAALRTKFDPAVDPFNLVVHPDADGVGGKVATATTATLAIVALRIVGPPAIGDQVREIDIECRSISDPPAWVIA